MNPTCRSDNEPKFNEPRFKPGIGQVLQSLGLDVSYDRGCGEFVYYSNERADEIEVLDLVAGYGSLLLGHNHPALVTEATRFLTAGRPNHVQGSRRGAAERLAAELSRRTGRDDCVVFANSGTEAVEAALKHALLETAGHTFLALEGAFHGKTLGALQLTANPAFREPFHFSGFNVLRVRPNDLEHLEMAFGQVSDLAGFVFEPILGEGGVWPLSPSFARRIVDLCRDRNVPSIADECQTGMGRTGELLVSQALGIHPDYVILSKALGGGLAKISALLIDRVRYRPGFDFAHSSTFADDDFSCHIAQKTLELIDVPLLDACREKGEWLVERLRRLHRSYPRVIADVRGTGLLLGIEFRDQLRSKSFLLRQLSARQMLGIFVAAYLLKEHRIRIAPTLSEPLTLRVQPTALVSAPSLERFVDALAETCARLDSADVLQLTHHLPHDAYADQPFVSDGTPTPNETYSTAERVSGAVQAAGFSHGKSTTTEVACAIPLTVSALASAPSVIWFQPAPAERVTESTQDQHLQIEKSSPDADVRTGDADRSASDTNRSAASLSFAWLFHLIDAEDVPYLEPSLVHASIAERNAFLARLTPLAEPIVMPRVEIRSAVGSCIGLWPILLPVTSAWLKQQIESRRPQELKRLLGRSIDVAETLGADLVSLGQFTSIVSSNGRNLVAGRIGLTTGNSYTTALIVEAVRNAHRELGMAPETSTLAVVGAAGNIGRACAEILAPEYRRVILVGRERPAARQQLRALAHRIGGATASCDLADVCEADVVVCATNCLEPVLGPDHLRPGAIVCDASVPRTIRPETAGARPDLTLFRGGIVRLPHRERLDIPGFPLPPGHAFGCLAEGAILCFEGVRDASYTGRLHPEKIARITQLAARHGFGPPIRDRRERDLLQER